MAAFVVFPTQKSQHQEDEKMPNPNGFRFYCVAKPPKNWPLKSNFWKVSPTATMETTLPAHSRTYDCRVFAQFTPGANPTVPNRFSSCSVEGRCKRLLGQKWQRSRAHTIAIGRSRKSSSWGHKGEAGFSLARDVSMDVLLADVHTRSGTFRKSNANDSLDANKQKKGGW